MIYITGDTHGERARLRHLPYTASDTLIVCGDFGYLFTDTPEERQFLSRCEKRLPFTLCFLDGNHENFDAIERYPVVPWHGGQARQIRRNIFHLMRGQIYTIGGHTFFTMGGGYSIDRALRQEGVSYWPQELPTDAEYKQAGENLRAHGMQVDYVLSHTAPREIVRMMGFTPDEHEMELEGFLEYVLYDVHHTHWYCGHWHQDRQVTDKFTVLWWDTVQIPEKDAAQP